MDESAYPVAYTAYMAGKARAESGALPVEEAVTLYVNAQPLVTLMCTPTLLDALALGFLFNEGFIRSSDDVVVLRPCGGGRCVDVWLRFDIEIPERRVLTSGCSGGTTFDDLAGARSRVETDVRVGSQDVVRLMDELARRAALHQRSGGVHTAALASGGRMVCLAEDVGRHNALDKVAGLCLQERRSPRGGILLSSGRISSEMVQKAARMEVPLVISRTAPTSLAVQLAAAWGITLVGYARRDGFRVYTHPERVTDDPEQE